MSVPRLFVGLVVILGLAGVVPIGSHASNESSQPIHIGHTKKIVRDVRGSFAGKPERRIAKADKVFFSQNIITAGKSAVLIRFRDGSTLELGADGMLILNEMVFNPFEGRSRRTVSLIHGAFRYVSGLAVDDQKMTINTPIGTIGIRGSAVSGIVHPDMPLFVHVSHGEAIFINDAGNSRLVDGEAIAIPSKDTQPITPDQMPPTVTAQALKHIKSRLGELVAITDDQDSLSDEQRQDDATANAIPIAQQESMIPPTAPPRKSAPPLPVIPLLSEGRVNGFFIGGQSSRKHEEILQRFANEAQASMAFISDYTSERQRVNDINVQAGTIEVITGAVEKSTSNEMISTLVEKSVRSNPSQAKTIGQAALRANPGALSVITDSVLTAMPEAAGSISQWLVIDGEDGNDFKNEPPSQHIPIVD